MDTQTIGPADAGTISDPIPPIPVGPPPDLTIPDGDPTAGAIELLHRSRPDAPSLLAARFDPAVTLPRFIRVTGRALQIGAALRARAGIATPASPAAEVLTLVRAIRRWRTGAELRELRARIVPRLRRELAAVEGELRTLCADIARGDAPIVGGGGAPHRAGLAHPHDEFIRRAQELLEARASLRGRLARLDGPGDAGRAAAVRTALEAAGGADAVAELLAPSMDAPSSDELARVRRGIGEVSDRIAGTDPATRRAAELSGRLAAMQAQAARLGSDTAGERARAAEGLVGAALAGELEAIGPLEAAVRPGRPELAEALAAIRGDEAALEGVIDELIRPAG